MLPFALAFDADAAGHAGAAAGRALLRRLAAEQLGIAPEDVPLVQRCPDCGGPHGRPMIDGSELRVSLARCELGAVAVAAWGADIGVDVEPLVQSAERLAAIREVAGGDGIAHWTRVEAVLKADGRGLRVDPRRVRVSGAAAWVDGEPARYRIIEPSLDTPVQVSVALASGV
jgi:4'-phosphopantetheinyl transferase